jgi:GNAT superfamily N-acetyltransferase
VTVEQRDGVAAPGELGGRGETPRAGSDDHDSHLTDATREDVSMSDRAHPTMPAPDASVRRARPADTAAMAALTLASWRAQPADLVPVDTLDAVSVDDVAAEWLEAVAAPPSRRHVVLVALEGEELVGYALVAPSQDPDSDGSSGEVADLVVRADRTRRGHGSRLLAAVVDTLREVGTAELLVWVAVGDDARLEFLASAGLAADGASRTLDGGPGAAVLRQVRWSARIDRPATEPLP